MLLNFDIESTNSLFLIEKHFCWSHKIIQIKCDIYFRVIYRFIPLFVKICYVQTEKKSLPNHFIGAASTNKVKASINNILLSLEIYLCDFKLLLADFAECKGVLIALLLTTFLKQFDNTHL
jgi:hypothetical protein